MANPLSSGLDKVKGALAGLLEPALIFAATGSKSAAIWGGMKAVLIAKVLGPLSLISGALLGVIGTVKLLIGSTEMLGKGMNKLRSMETIKTQFQPLLGGAAAAQERLEELYTFAATTPFQMEEIAEASKTLQVLTKGALATGDGLRMVGDAAAVAGQSMQSVAFHVGRLYDGLQSGSPIGEASMRLQEMGLISGEARRKIDASRQAGDDFVKTFEIFEKEMERTKGGMEELSKTLGGLESTLTDVRAGFQAKFAENFLDAEKQSVKTLITLFEIFEEPIARIGHWFSRLATWVGKAMGAFVEFAGGAKGLGNNLSYLVDAFAVFATAVASVQLTTIVTGLISLGKATGVATAFTKANSLVAIFNSNVQLGLLARLKLVGNEWLTYTLKQKAAAIGGLFAGGVYKALALIFGMLKQAIDAATAAMLRNPWALALAAVVAVIMAVSRFNSNLDEQAKRLADLKQKYRELNAELDKTIKSIDTFSKKQSSIAEIKAKIKEGQDAIAAFGKEMEEVGMLGQVMGEKDGMAEQLKAQSHEVDMLIAKLGEVQAIDNNILKIGEKKRKLMEDEVAQAQKLRDLQHEIAMINATDAEIMSIQVQKRMELETTMGRSKETMEGDVAREDFKRGQGEHAEEATAIQKNIDKAKRDLKTMNTLAGEVEAIGVNIQNIDAIRATDWTGLSGESENVEKLNALIREMNEVRTQRGDDFTPTKEWEMPTQFGDGIDISQITGGAGTFAEFEEFLQNAQEDAANLWTKPNADLNEANRKLEELKDNAMGWKNITAETADLIGEKYTGQDIGLTADQTPMGKKVAIEERLNNASVTTDASKAGQLDEDGKMLFTAKQLDNMRTAVEFLKQEAERYHEIELQVKKLKAEREEMLRPMRMAIELLEIEKGLHEDMMGITEKTYANQFKAAEAEAEAAAKKLDTVKRLSDETKSLGDMNEKLAWMKGEAGPDGVPAEMEDEHGKFVTYEEDMANRGVTEDKRGDYQAEAIAEQEKMIKLQEDANHEIFAAEKALDAANKKIADLNTKKLRELLNTFREISILATSLDVDMNLDLSQFGKAHDAMASLIAQEDDLWRTKRLESLRAAGLFEEDQITKIIAKEEANRRKEKEKGRRKQGLKVGTGELFAGGQEGTGEFQRARLDMNARVFGDSKARDKSQALENRDFFRESLKENINLGFGKEKSVALAKTALDTKLMGEAKSVQVTTDSFRKVGAGGYAVATDPMRKLAEKRNRALDAIAADIRKLIPLNEEIANKDLEPKVG